VVALLLIALGLTQAQRSSTRALARARRASKREPQHSDSIGCRVCLWLAMRRFARVLLRAAMGAGESTAAPRLLPDCSLLGFVLGSSAIDWLR
jgi:hypothetical protein